MITLQQGQLTATINPLGAELTSLFHAGSGIEYLWQANPAYWGKHSPVLFPVVGSLQDNRYLFEGKEYHLSRHGFARERLFSSEVVSNAEAVFTLTDDEHSRAIYPFYFRFRLIYKLKADSLSVTFSVFNSGQKTLWFSVGGHPAFRIPLIEGGNFRDYYLQFNMNEPLERWRLVHGLISESRSMLPATSGHLPLEPSLFYDDAIVLKHLHSNRVTLGCNRHAHGLEVDFSGFPYLGIWAAKDAPFVCIEPWCGHADTVSHTGRLKNKPGIERLESGENWERTWAVTVF